MNKAVLAVILLFLILLPAAAQSNDPEVDEWEDYRQDVYVRGDQAFIISLGTIFPLYFSHNGSSLKMNFTPPVGGGGSLSYNYFLTKDIFIGGEIGIQFISSIAKDTLYFIPFGVRGGYQFLFNKIEVPITATLGMAATRFLSNGYFGLYTKLGVSGYYRATQSWSFGLTTNWFWYPQWTAGTANGHMLDINISARYLF